MAARMSARPTSERVVPKPPAGYSVRGATFDDLFTVIEFLQTCDIHASECRAGCSGERVVNHFEMIAPDWGAHELAGRFGYRKVRHLWQMAIELSEPVPETRPPDGLRVRTLDPTSDLPGVHAAVEDSFAEHWGHILMPFDDWAKLHLQDPIFDPTLWLLALDGEGEQEQLAGVLAGGEVDRARCEPAP